MEQMQTHVLAVACPPLAAIPDVEVEHVSDVAAALEHLAGGTYDVVVAGFGGDPEDLRAIREAAPDLPLVAMAGDDLAAAAADAGAHDHVPPDAGAEVLGRAIRYATSLHLLQAELHRRQTADELTGLYNARGFEQLAAHHLQLANRTKQPLVLLFLRLDDLAGLSERSGAGEGPRLLAETADVLRQVVRGSDVLARVGADRFCVLLTGEAAGTEALVLSRLVDAVAVRNAKAGRAVPLSLAVGAATYDPANPVDLAALISEADRRMREGADRAQDG